MFYIGCPLWGYKEWLGNFMPAHTPPSDFLHVYSRRLTAVEGNTVFYALPRMKPLPGGDRRHQTTFASARKSLVGSVIQLI